MKSVAKGQKIITPKIKIDKMKNHTMKMSFCKFDVSSLI